MQVHLRKGGGTAACGLKKPRMLKRPEDFGSYDGFTMCTKCAAIYFAWKAKQVGSKT